MLFQNVFDVIFLYIICIEFLFINNYTFNSFVLLNFKDSIIISTILLMSGIFFKTFLLTISSH